MRHRVRIAALVAWAVLGAVSVPSARGVERFPPPDFTDHTLPEATQPPPAHVAHEYLDLAALAAGLGLATYLALVSRSRRGLLVLALVSLAWLGFWRKGCICPIGAIQNVSLAVADPSYAIPAFVVALFVLPIVVTLFFGRTFCAAVCPLGAVQEWAALWPVRVPAWLDQGLGLLAYVYLGAAVVLASTGTAFVICEYDPFVGLFRRAATTGMLGLGAGFLIVGLFVARPYCRYLCPYGAILGLCSKASKYHLRIPPEECIKCRLCEDVCPYGAIWEPTVEQTPRERLRARNRLAAMLVLLPALLGAGALVGRGLAIPLARLHPRVLLAEYLRQAESAPAEETPPEALSPRLKQRNDALDAFRNTGRPAQEVYDEAAGLVSRFRGLGAWLGAWVGLVFGAKLIHLSIRRRRADYQPDRANCVSCGRCFWYCPPEQLRLGLIETLPVVPVVPGAEPSKEGAKR